MIWDLRLGVSDPKNRRTSAQPLGAVSVGGWSTTGLETGADATRAWVDDEKPVTIEHPAVASWLYLGDGYPNRGTPPKSSFLIDVESVRSRVVANGG